LSEKLGNNDQSVRSFFDPVSGNMLVNKSDACRAIPQQLSPPFKNHYRVFFLPLVKWFS